jgi:two-component system NtrC family sensor kinase
MLKLGLRVKFFLYSNTLILVTMVLVTIFTVAHERTSRYQAIERRGRSLTEAMSVPITDALMYEELDFIVEDRLIEDYISEMQALNRDLMRYVVVADARGTVTHSTNWNQLAKPFDRALDASSVGHGSVAEIRTGPAGQRVLEIRTPLNVSTKFWGSLAVGYSLKPIEGQVRAIAKQAALLAILLLIGNSALTAIYVETLIRPILALHRSIRRAADGDLSVRARTRGTIEVAELAGAFNGLMDEVEEARDREHAQRAQLAHTEKMAAVGTLAAGVAHEVNNPLGGILTCIENLRARPGDRAMVERYLSLIEDGLKRIERTTMNLLDFSRQRKMELTITSVNNTIRHVVELVKYQLRKGRIDVQFDLDRSDPVMMADPFQIEQLFLNLVLNALQAMPDGGRLTLRTRRKPDNVVVEVEDTGEGIPDDIRGRVFDPFFTTREVGEGTGLGLTVSDSIVASHGGTLAFNSVVGKGTVFRVSFSALDQGSVGEQAS